jgi:uncharacterized phage infection (PIP) family protein YhgE
VPFQILIDIQCVEILGVESGQQHVDNDSDIDFVLVRDVLIAVFLRFYSTLNILIIGIELRNRMIRAVLPIVIIDDPTQSGFLFVGIFLIVETLLGQILLNLLHVLVAFGRRREDTGYIQRLVLDIFCLPLLLNRPE